MTGLRRWALRTGGTECGEMEMKDRIVDKWEDKGIEVGDIVFKGYIGSRR
jgi:hypothetical protein